MDLSNQQAQPHHGGQRPGRGRGRGRGRGAGRGQDPGSSHHGASSGPGTRRVMKEEFPSKKNGDSSKASQSHAQSAMPRPVAHQDGYLPLDQQRHSQSSTSAAFESATLALPSFRGSHVVRDPSVQAVPASNDSNVSYPFQSSALITPADSASQSQRLMAMLKREDRDEAANEVDGQPLDERIRGMLLRDPNRPAETDSAAEMHAPSVHVSDQAEKQNSRKRLTQAQRRQGMSNKLDLSNPPTTPNTTRTGPRDVYSPGGLNHYQGPSWTPHYYDQANSFTADGRMNDGPPGFQSSSHAPQYGHPASNPPPPHHPNHMHSPQSPPYLQNHHNGRFDQPAGPGDFHRQSWGPRAHPMAGHNARPSADFSSRPPGPAGRRLFDHNPRQRQDSLPPAKQAEYLDHLAAELVPQMAVTPDETFEHSKIQKRIRDIVRQALLECEDTKGVPEDSIQLACFGSMASGFGMRGSDSDLMLFYDESTLSEEQQTAVPRMIEKALLDQGHGARLLTRTRVPIIRFCSKPAAGLLEALRLERAKWEEEKDKLPDKEGESGEDGEEKEAAEGEDDTHEHTHDEEDGNEEEDEEAESPVDGTQQSGPTTSAQNGTSTEKANEQSEKEGKKMRRKPKRKMTREKGDKNEEKNGEPKETGPPPYKNDEERAQLYRQAIKEDWFSPEERLLIKQFSTALEKSDGSTEDEGLVAARQALDVLPNVLSRYREPRKRRQELEFPEGSGLLCDINFSIGAHSNPLGVHNTRMLHCYSQFDPRITEMVVFVKGWAKRRKINKPYHGTLSSYGYVLMVLHYAVNVAHPPLAPNLQLLHIRNHISQQQYPEFCGEWDIRFWQDLAGIRHASEWEFPKNRSSLGQLLAGFFRYFAVHDYRGHRGFEWMKDVLSLRTRGGLLSKEEKGWTGKVVQSSEAEDAVAKKREITHRYLVAIEDPFEHSHNVGRPVMHHGIVAIREEFRRANQLIMNGGLRNGQFEGLFDPGEEREREHRFFGPNPKFKKPPFIGPKNLVGEERRKALEKAEKLAAAEEAAAAKSAKPGAVTVTSAATSTTAGMSKTKSQQKHSKPEVKTSTDATSRDRYQSLQPQTQASQNGSQPNQQVPADRSDNVPEMIPALSTRAAQSGKPVGGTFRLTMDEVHAHHSQPFSGHTVAERGSANGSGNGSVGGGSSEGASPAKRGARRRNPRRQKGGAAAAAATVESTATETAAAESGGAGTSQEPRGE